MNAPKSATLPPGAFAGLPEDIPGGARGLVRIIPAELEAVTFFEDLTPGADVDALLSILSLTSAGLLDPIGDPARIPAWDRAYGPGSGWVMPSFSRRGRPSRFSDGRFGVWSAASDVMTAVAETIYHLRLLETSEPAQAVALQLLRADVGGFAAILSDLAAPLGPAIHNPASYVTSQLVGSQLRDRGSDAIVYRSVRRKSGTCVGVLRPRAVRRCHRTGQISYQWDGARLAAGAARPSS